LQSASDLPSAQRLQAIWVRNDLAHHLDPNAQELEPTERSVVGKEHDIAEIMGALPHADCNRCLTLLMEVDSTNWQQSVLTLLKRGEAGRINFCIDALCDNGRASALQDALEGWLQEQKIPSALLMWVIKHRADPRYQPWLKPLLNVRMLHCILQTIDNEALYLNPGRRILLAEELGKDETLLQDLLHGIPLELAKEVANLFRLNRGLSDSQQKALLSRLTDTFPELKKSFKQEQPQEETIWVSQSSLDAAKAEYDVLVKEKIPANKTAIAKARELGDLSENAEYKMAKQDQLVLMARKSMLESTINHCQVIDLTAVRTEKVGIGTAVVLQEGKQLHTYTILGALDGNPDKNIVSYKTPFAQTLLGKKVGEKATLPNGKMVTIHAIQRCKI
jgi:transcription elongation GreA/GreB family factor